MRTRHTAYRFRAFPTPEQTERLIRWQHAQRALWNAANGARLMRKRDFEALRAARSDAAPPRVPGYVEQCRELTEARRELDWLSEVPTDYQQSLLRRLDLAWKDFFSGRAMPPRFKSKSRGDVAPLVTDAANRFVVDHGRAKLPKLGWLRFRQHRKIEGRPFSIAVTREVDQWFVSIACEVTEPVPVHPRAERAVGLDVGVASVLTDSNGNSSGNPRHFDRSRRNMTRAQRKLARCKKGSNRRQRAKTRVAKVHRKISRQRLDFLHNLTALYTKSHGTIVVEDLAVDRMTRSARGTVEAPGRNVRQKAGLNRSILDAGWGELRRQLVYKAEREGGRVVVVPAPFTSQTCNACGTVDAASRVDQATFRCVGCGHEAHADVNAARNILARGITGTTAGESPASARGGFAVGQPVNRERVA